MNETTVPANEEIPVEVVADAPNPNLVPGLALEVIELDIANPGPPVFDVEVTMPARALHVYAVIKRPEASKVVSRQAEQPQGKLFPRVVFETVPGSAKTKMRLALVQAGDSIPADVSDDVTYLGCFIHPIHSMPIAVYRLPYYAIDDATVDAGEITIAPQTSE